MSKAKTSPSSDCDTVSRSLPPLLVQIDQPGQPSRIEEIADPRIAYCRELSKQGKRWGITARPITRRRRKAVRHA